MEGVADVGDPRPPVDREQFDPRRVVLLAIFYGGNLDVPISEFLGNQAPNNFFALRNRNGEEGWRFFAHDSEHTLLTNDPNRDRTGPYPAGGSSVSKSNPQWLFQRLMANANFKPRFADRVQQHFTNGGALTPPAVAARLNRRVAQLDRAIVGESARWPRLRGRGDQTSATNERYIRINHNQPRRLKCAAVAVSCGRP